MNRLKDARIAIVHEWPVEYAGSEQVVAAMLEVFPEADLHALVHDPDGLRGTPLERVPVKTSFIQSLPLAKKKYRSYFPLMPLAVEQFDFRPYDLVISSNHAVAKGVLTRADQLHVSYVHTPVRYAWDLYLDYLQEGGMDRGIKGSLARLGLHYLRLWDLAASNRVDAYLTNSAYVARRVRKLYRRPSRVMHPPVNVDRYRPGLPREDFFVTVSRFVPYKRVDLIVRAFAGTGRELMVIGDGPDRAKIERLAGPNIRLLGRQPDEVVVDHLQRARAFVFAAEEDFGITPVEAQAAGCPVIAYGKGGALETVVGWPDADATGLFFDSQTPEALIEAVNIFEGHLDEFHPETSRRNAERFSRQRFCHEFRVAVEYLWDRFHSNDLLE